MIKFLNPEKNFAQIRALVFEKNAKTAQLRHTPFPKNDVIEPKAKGMLPAVITSS